MAGPLRDEVTIPLSVHADQDLPVVHVTGEIDVASVPVLASALQAQIESGQRHVILDLEGVSFMDSSGLGQLVSHHKALRRLGGGLLLANPSPRVQAVLTITALDQVFHVYPSVGAALAQRA
jgi:anti-anti-sigma factor